MTRNGPWVIQSADGTPIAIWTEGTGPPLVLVHGALADHSTFAPLVRELQASLTTFSMDRRGRGASGDSSGEYDIEREFEDVSAVVDAVAARTGQTVALWGYSYGADCAMGAARLTKNVNRLVLYEPGFGTIYPAGSVERIRQAIEAGDREKAILTLLEEIIDMTQDEVELLRSSPLWPARLAIAPTMPRELRAEGEWIYELGQFDQVTAPTLILAGSESPAIQVEATRNAEAALPDARVRELQGQGHIAHQSDPGMVASVILEFVLAPGGADVQPRL